MIEAKPLTADGVLLRNIDWGIPDYESSPKLWSEVFSRNARIPPEMLATVKAESNFYRSLVIQMKKRIRHSLRVRRRKLKGGHKK